MAGEQTVEIVDMTPIEKRICRSRGDTFPFDLTIKLNGVAVNVTTDSFVLTVDPDEAPDDAANNLFANIPTIVDGPNGIIRVTLSVSDADQTPDSYFYDLQQTSGSATRTIMRGSWVVSQDISK